MESVVNVAISALFFFAHDDDNDKKLPNAPFALGRGLVPVFRN